MARGAREEEPMEEIMNRVEVIPDYEGGNPWARAYGPTWRVAVFANVGSIILDITTIEGGLSLQHGVADILRRAPEIADLYGVQLDVAELAAVIDACRAALADKTASCPCCGRPTEVA